MKLVHISIDKNQLEIEFLSFPQKQGWIDYCGLFVFVVNYGSLSKLTGVFTVIVDILYLRRLITLIAWVFFPLEWPKEMTIFHKMYFDIPRK